MPSSGAASIANQLNQRCCLVGADGASVDKLQQFEVLRTAFPFGYCDVGMLFFHLGNHIQRIWLIYGEMYTELVADSFEEFMEKAVFDKKWDFD